MGPKLNGEIGDHLREIRKERRVTGKELAKELGVTQGTVSKIERGRLTPDVGYVSHFAHLFRLEASRTTELFELLGVVPSGTTPAAFLRFVPFDLISSDWSRRRQETVRLAENRTKRLWAFQPLAIPGLLQTPAYAEAIARLAGIKGSRAIARTVQARLERQSVLSDPAKDCRFIVSEASLRARLVPNEVLCEQIRRLIRLSQNPHTPGQVLLGILPLDEAVSVLPTGGYYVFDDRVYVELLHGDLWVLDAHHVRQSYERHFVSLLESAAVGPRCDAVLRRILKDLKAAA